MTFSDISWLMRGNFLRAEAESYWNLGQVENAAAKYQALIDMNPDWAWRYIGWSDHHWLFTTGPKDFKRAEHILRQALKRPNLEDRDVVLERPRDLRKQRAQARGPKAARQRRKPRR